ncbi:MAG: hypothetical protein A2Y82_02710 [Candidatus Buchananbacteria bacterium RBG_13_36_9]|uniref:Uncharacterized protein n=1 Tax=Candidatus Buchananbacteria bacterium RBG_13_36_9 TaxID=1797530 RepID=A0A1G1XP96_9BACT|nr:MAG: hypothetical protein A2Y82_02710 [Candidatus Buchananbacteria bacterium RBG_13_36_9]
MPEDKIIQKLLEHDDRFEKLEGKMDENFRKVNDTLESIVTIVQRLDQERIFTAEWVKRIEKEVEDHTKEIKDMKLKLNIT